MAPEDKRLAQQAEQRAQAQQIVDLRGWWLNRMATGPRPFQEKMVLFWHGHFATSYEKVRDAYYMWRQNDLFRQMGTDYWLRLLVAAGQDPAMLTWLDQAQSRKEHPNENYAREVMELFSLGEGHYTEKDVTEAARALTGWSLDRQTEQFIYRPLFHDPGVKTVLGLTGNLNGDDVMNQIVSQRQSAIFITGKLWNYFAGQMPSLDLNDALADGFIAGGRHFKPFLRMMFSSGEFYSDSIIRNGSSARRGCCNATSRPLSSAPPFCARSARICSRRRTSRAGTAASHGSRRTRCWSVTMTPQRWCRERPSSLPRPILRANRAGRAAWSRKRPHNASTSAAWTWRKS
jgi:uncharacterized protein (DUF1800 family)